MQLTFVADPLESFKTYKDSTFAMMREAASRGHTLLACEPQQLRWQRGGPVQAQVREITLTGDIDQNAVNRLSQSLSRLEQQSCSERWMVLNAPSGQIGAAVTMGAMLRNRNFNTRVAPGSECLTSCVLVFAAGRERVLGSNPPLARLGISRVPPDADFGSSRCEAEISRAQALTLTRYLRAMLPSQTA
ncbi:MAG: hypothetical protein Q8M96_13545, partial [Rubrivivax sp.]|nr:hypothetical protein [Rubrivivax sp.]